MPVGVAVGCCAYYVTTTVADEWQQRGWYNNEMSRLTSAVYQARRDVLVEGLQRIGWEVETPKASMFVWARYPQEWRDRMGSIDFSMKLLDEAEVAVSPGRGFGELGEGYLRLALVENEHRLRQAVRQIGRCLRGE